MISGRLLVLGIVVAALALFLFTLVVVLRGPGDEEPAGDDQTDGAGVTSSSERARPLPAAP